MSYTVKSTPQSSVANSLLKKSPKIDHNKTITELSSYEIQNHSKIRISFIIPNYSVIQEHSAI